MSLFLQGCQAITSRAPAGRALATARHSKGDGLFSQEASARRICSASYPFSVTSRAVSPTRLWGRATFHLGAAEEARQDRVDLPVRQPTLSAAERAYQHGAKAADTSDVAVGQRVVVVYLEEATDQ